MIVEKNIKTQNEEVAGGWRKLHSEELHTLYSAADMIRAIKPRTTRWARSVARTEGKESPTIFWHENAKEGGHCEDLGVDGRVILNGC